MPHQAFPSQLALHRLDFIPKNIGNIFGGPLVYFSDEFIWLSYKNYCTQIKSCKVLCSVTKSCVLVNVASTAAHNSFVEVVKTGPGWLCNLTYSGRQRAKTNHSESVGTEVVKVLLHLQINKRAAELHCHWFARFTLPYTNFFFCFKDLRSRITCTARRDCAKRVLCCSQWVFAGQISFALATNGGKKKSVLKSKWKIVTVPYIVKLLSGLKALKFHQ